MAETIISPGVFQRENDISFISPAPAEVGACVIGPTVKGPVEVPTTVTSYNQYVRVFGETFESASTKQEFLTSLAAKNYFSQGGDSLLVASVKDLPNIFPAIKRGQQVKTEFKLPIIIKD